MGTLATALHGLAAQSFVLTCTLYDIDVIVESKTNLQEEVYDYAAKPIVEGTRCWAIQHAYQTTTLPSHIHPYVHTLQIARPFVHVCLLGLHVQCPRNRPLYHIIDYCVEGHERVCLPLLPSL